MHELNLINADFISQGNNLYPPINQSNTKKSNIYKYNLLANSKLLNSIFNYDLSSNLDDLLSSYDFFPSKIILLIKFNQMNVLS